MLLLDQRDSPVPLLDTTTLHSQALVDFAMRDDCELLNTQSSLSK
jgi:aspartate/glutamate racemase